MVGEEQVAPIFVWMITLWLAMAMTGGPNRTPQPAQPTQQAQPNRYIGIVADK
jgi:hypothetical protein